MTQLPFQVLHASGLHAVERTLAIMHQDSLRRTDDDTPATRLSVLTLVAACSDVESADLASQTVGRLAATHPARAIIVVANADAPEGIDADLSLQSADHGGIQVCAEQIRLAVGGDAANHLTSIVMPLIVPDVPLYLWLVGSPPLDKSLDHDAMDVCERIIIDTGAYPDPAATLAVLNAELHRSGNSGVVADLAWARGHSWRELVAKAFSGDDMRALIEDLTRVDIECSGDRESPQAWLLVGWLGSRLGWEAAGPDISITARFVPDVPVREILSVRLTMTSGEREATIQMDRYDDTVQTTIDVSGGATVTQTAPVEVPDIPKLIASLMEASGGGDEVYAAAVDRAAVLSRAHKSSSRDGRQ